MSIIASSNFFTARKSRSQYQIERSLRFNSADSAYLNRTFGTASGTTKGTWSGWLKRTKFGTAQMLWSGSNYEFVNFTTADKIQISNPSGTPYWISTMVFRDPSAWYHIVIAFDTTLATAADRCKLWVNGVQVTQWDSNPTITQNSTFAIWNVSGNSGSIGRFHFNNTQFLDGYQTELYWIDGQALTPSSFGETDTITGVWKPKKYSGSGYGTNGFFLKFADNSGTTAATLGKDSSGNGNNWTPNNFSVTAGAGNDSLIDTPTPYADGGNGRGNYCTWNPLAVDASALCTFANGNLDVTTNSAGGNAFGTFAIPTSGKWYWEVVCTTGNNPLIGIAAFFPNPTYGFQNTNAVGYYVNGQKYVDAVASAYGSSYTTQTIGVAADADAGTITFYRDNVSQGSITHAVAGLFPTVSDGASALTDTFVTNFGQRAFAYTPPSGFKALNTQNLPEPTIKNGSSYFDTVLYTGTGSSLTPTSSLGFSPDLVWIKGRSGATDHALYDAVRGVQLDLVSNSTDTETTQAQGLTAFNSNGFTVGTLAKLNTNTATYVAWCWDESATPGFDIVTYTGTGVAGLTVSHSLGVAPSMMIVKRRDSAVREWWVYHSTLGATKAVVLSSTSGAQTSSTYWNNTAPTSSVFSLGTGGDLNASSGTYVAYLWSEVAGFSKFGSYTGNGNSNGPFVFCGFRPAWVIVKMSSSSGNWTILDNKREGYNVDNDPLFPNLANAEGTTDLIDITSNGFKVRTTDATFNTSSGTYIFAAYAESPFKFALAR